MSHGTHSCVTIIKNLFYIFVFTEIYYSTRLCRYQRKLVGMAERDLMKTNNLDVKFPSGRKTDYFCDFFAFG